MTPCSYNIALEDLPTGSSMPCASRVADRRKTHRNRVTARDGEESFDLTRSMALDLRSITSNQSCGC